MQNETNEYPAYPASLQSLNDAMRFAASRENFEIHPALLYAPGQEKKNVFLVALRGTNRSFDKTDVLGLNTCLMAFLGKPNIYLDLVKKGMSAKIPTGSEVVMIGHSLGGMIAQMIVADEEMKAAYRFLNVLNIGSPYVPVKDRPCPLHRFADKADIVPWLGRSIKANLKTEKPVFKSNGYFGRIVAAHTDSYRNSPSWRPYDVFGELDGGRVLVFTDHLAESSSSASESSSADKQQV